MGKLGKDILRRDILYKSIFNIINKNDELTYLSMDYKLLFTYFPGACVVCNSNGTIIEINESFLKLMQCTKEEIDNKSLFEILHLENNDVISKYVDIMIKGSITLEADIITKTKDTRNIEVTIIPILKKQILLGMFMILLDHTEKRELEKSLNELKRNDQLENLNQVEKISSENREDSLAQVIESNKEIQNTENMELKNKIIYNETHDGLTKLYNRSFLTKQMNIKCEEAKEKGSSFAFMIIDIDGFKYINDALGYQLGDNLIIQIAQRLEGFLDESNLISRYAGDQFAIIVPELNTIEEYESIVRGINDLFFKSFKVDIYELYITVSIGISIYPEDGEETDSLKKHASVALLGAKNEGKNRYKFYSSKMDIQSYKQFMLRNDLRKAIEKGQFKLYYQPQVSLKNSEIIAVEALIRWEHPTWGLVSPDEFIVLAEENGLIVNLGKWVLRKVCSTYREWMNNGLPDIKVSINYSSIQFYEKNFVENIEEVLNEFELNPEFLVMEITENALMNNLDQAVSYIKKLQTLGIQIAIDDFGSKFSSLSYLNKFNVDILKLDRSFIKTLLLDETSSIITASVVNLARELRIKLVAEGIENWDQLSYLKKLNCYAGQGFLYSRPVPLEEFQKILADKRCKPSLANDYSIGFREERRKFFRIKFTNLLEGDMAILKFNGRDVKIGNTKVIIKDIGPGGLCFISNIRIPITVNATLQFKTELLEEEVKVYGSSTWTEEISYNLFEYGVEFTFSENERMVLTRVLNKFQIKMRNQSGFSNGRFISENPIQYFK